MRRIILDTDIAMGAPGSDIDDGFALALAVDLSDQTLELVTTVNGNTDVDTSTVLALDLLGRLARTDVPVVKGARRPLLRPLHDHPARDRVAGVRDRLTGREPAPGRTGSSRPGGRSPRTPGSAPTPGSTTCARRTPGRSSAARRCTTRWPSPW